MGSLFYIHDNAQSTLTSYAEAENLSIAVQICANQSSEPAFEFVSQTWADFDKSLSLSRHHQFRVLRATAKIFCRGFKTHKGVGIETNRQTYETMSKMPPGKDYLSLQRHQVPV